MIITLLRRPLALALLLLAGVMVVLPSTSDPRGLNDPAMPVVPPTDTTDVVPNIETSVPALADIGLQFRHGRQAVPGHLLRLMG